MIIIIITIKIIIITIKIIKKHSISINNNENNK